MKKHDLLKDGNNIIRVLEIRPDKILIIDCVKRTMPVWVASSVLDAFSECTAEVLNEAMNFTVTDIENLNPDQKRTMYDRYTLIAPILPFIADERMRSKVISSIATEHNISKQTVRNYLCLYLVYMNITVLASKQRLDDDAELTQDEKNIRWALNKFFYTTKKQSLMTAYTMMLKEKYCNGIGVLTDKYPSFYQFRYFYRKTKKMQNFYISRNGLKNYQRNNRPLIGDGIQSFAPAIGVGMLDSTVCDIYLINDTGSLVGRPILTACIDAYSGLCCGYVLSWMGGVYSLRGLMLNIIADKVDWCKQFGISINAEDWSCDKLPATMVTDMGSEYKSENFEQIAELGVKVINLPSYRPELKGMVEKFFDVVQSTYKKHLKGKGVIEPDYQERGAHDYRKDACLTMVDFEEIILHCIIYYNSQRIVENFPYTEALIAENVKPYASCIWNWGKSQMGANLIEVGAKELILTLLPRTTGKFSRFGLKVNKMRYHCDGYTEQYLNGGEVTIAYNPEDVTFVWLLENEIYIKFTIIESRFEGKDLTAVQSLQTAQRSITKGSNQDNLQAQIKLARHIETIVDNVGEGIDVSIKNIRDNRKREQSKQHRDYMKGAQS
ncbi:Mu transposase C-terminal domain-containing protein [Sporomusa sphaeroides DSM 2875]|uniref:Mu transposase C-terminal domain-containing protein n=1 Tax=Sporomusa sphaeroides TaxID=47679 RepID=UPI00202E204E|nr:Mu transposase C-terminal domain-containing protein [Sporomusa sphaeroides]MCM0757745.1 Mu transposase C-terminal domain-containing protein [Sporomusa sphaeroides DSM 2875]